MFRRYNLCYRSFRDTVQYLVKSMILSRYENLKNRLNKLKIRY